MLEFVEHLFTYQFLNRALITSIIVGIVCGTVGSLIVLRGLSLMGDAMSHAVLPGVALSFLFGIPMFVGALITGMIASILSVISHLVVKRNLTPLLELVLPLS